ncbi:MAG: hypothetical protein F6K10_13310 [Moorea sp. SIO2B7]|nr:hypothetical protein [Moorena sp. SIO2B7]
MFRFSLFLHNCVKKTISKVLVLILLALAAGCAKNVQHNLKGDNTSDLSETSSDYLSQCSSNDPFAEAIEKAITASILTKSAKSAKDWNLVVLNWIQAIERMQAIPVSSPKYTFAQKKVVEYLANLKIAQQKAGEVKNKLPFASFNSEFLNEQLLLFLSYIAAIGSPDVLIVGSSRAVQGIDPRYLQYGLATEGKGDFKVFNFGVNGATAQVVDLMVRELLTPEQMPKIIIWADGVRAFNSGRVDRTYNAIATSVGYKSLLTGDRPTSPLDTSENPNACDLVPESPNSNKILLPEALLRIRNGLRSWSSQVAFAADIKAIDPNGFLPTSPRFNPRIYYQKYPRVSGRYDADYQKFNLGGEQANALDRFIAYTKEQQIPLVIINLPLSRDYLDQVRRRYEQKFRILMKQKAQAEEFIFIDLANQWLNYNGYFADPSHLNRYGAAEVAKQLVGNPQIQWPQSSSSRR